MLFLVMYFTDYCTPFSSTCQWKSTQKWEKNITKWNIRFLKPSQTHWVLYVTCSFYSFLGEKNKQTKKKLSKCSLERILFEPKLCASTLLCCLRIEMAGAPSSFNKQAMVKREWQFTLLNKQIDEWLPWEQAMVCLEGFNFPTEHFHSPSEFYSHLINLLSYQTTWNRFWRFLTAN